MTALSSLLMSRPGDERLQLAWVRSLMPLASDPEQSCQVKGKGCFKNKNPLKSEAKAHGPEVACVEKMF